MCSLRDPLHGENSCLPQCPIGTPLDAFLPATLDNQVHRHVGGNGVEGSSGSAGADLLDLHFDDTRVVSAGRISSTKMDITYASPP